jgi:hypothetical protein
MKWLVHRNKYTPLHNTYLKGDALLLAAAHAPMTALASSESGGINMIVRCKEKIVDDNGEEVLRHHSWHLRRTSSSSATLCPVVGHNGIEGTVGKAQFADTFQLSFSVCAESKNGN